MYLIDQFVNSPVETNFFDYDTSPFSDNNTAILLVCGNLYDAIIIVTVTGTLTIIPVIPNYVPKIASASNIASGLKFMVLPIIHGSKILPVKNTIAVIAPTMIKQDVNESN